MAIRVSGLVSGLDTDSIVQELVAAYSTKKDKHVKAQTKLEWKMDAWKELNKKVKSLYNKLGNMKYSSYYNKKKTTISDSTKATVTASNNAINGTQELKINAVAATGYLTGAQLAAGTTGNTTLGELAGITDKGIIAVKTKNGTKNIEISADTKVSDFVNQLKDAGVSASYDATYRRMYISAKDSGIENDFALTAGDANGLQALKSLGIYVNSQANKDAYDAWDSYAVDSNGNTKYLMDADGNFQLDSNGKKIENTSFGTVDIAKTQMHIQNILNVIDSYQGKDAGSISELEAKNADLRSEMTNLQADHNYANAFITMKGYLGAKDSSDNMLLTADEQDELEVLLKKTDVEIQEAGQVGRFNELKAKLGFSDEEFAQLRSHAQTVKAYEEDPDADELKVMQDIRAAYGSADSTAELQKWVDTNADKIQDKADKIQENNNRIAAKQKYINDNALLTSSAPAATLTEEQLKNMSEAEIAAFKANDNVARAKALTEQFQYIQNIAKADTDYSDSVRADGTQAKRIDGSDASIELNGITYNSASNNITVNGITITALQKTAPGESVTITTQADAQGIYDGVKSFLKEYNALIKEMDELYNAASSKGYEPLTDDEKDAMSDKEIERWEEKIKKSILRRDDTLSSVMSLMTSTMNQGFTLSDGKRYSLASFGIKTQGYLYSADNEGYVYHIDGDSEDEVSAGNADRLLAAIQENPEMVQEFFQKLSDDLYTKLDKRMQSSTVKSRYSIYNDKKMQKDYDEYTKTIKKWEEKVTSMEDYYYNKFAAMEKALATLQQSTSALSGLLGS